MNASQRVAHHHKNFTLHCQFSRLEISTSPHSYAPQFLNKDCKNKNDAKPTASCSCKAVPLMIELTTCDAVVAAADVAEIPRLLWLAVMDVSRLG